jgi:serine/threonine-protein kinase
LSLCPSCNADAGDVAKFCPACGASIVRLNTSADDYTGRIIAGKFRVEKLLGEGGMGKVYKATQLSLDKTVVLKVLRQSLLSDSRTVARFQREAKAASRLNHPNSIGVIDFGQSEDGAMYIAMEYVSGQDLHQLLSAEGALPESRIVRIGQQVLSALSEAHAAGVIHRDLKPENIMVEQRRGEPDFVKVLDFGIAKIQESDGTEGQALTRAGFVCGTPEYMSPEQARGVALDARSDLYAVGVILYQCASGQLPFESDSAVGFATKHLTEIPVAPRMKRPDAFISDAMEALILKALAKNPGDRPQDAEEFRRDLLAIVEAGERTSVGPAPAPPPPAPKRMTGRHKAPSMSQATVAATTPGPPEPQRRAPSWDSSPGAKASSGPLADEDSTSTTLGPGAGGGKPETRSNAFAFLGVAAAAILLGGGAFTAYRTFYARGGPLLSLEPSTEPEAPEPGTLVVVPAKVDEPSSQPAAREVEAVRTLRQKGEEALANRNFDEALRQFTQAATSDPSPAASKRLALVYLMKSDARNAAAWLEKYSEGARGAPDIPYVRRYLDRIKNEANGSGP